MMADGLIRWRLIGIVMAVRLSDGTLQYRATRAVRAVTHFTRRRSSRLAGSRRTPIAADASRPRRGVERFIHLEPLSSTMGA